MRLAGEAFPRHCQMRHGGNWILNRVLRVAGRKPDQKEFEMHYTAIGPFEITLNPESRPGRSVAVFVNRFEMSL